MLAVFQNGLNSFYDSIEFDQPPLASYSLPHPSSLLLTDLAHILCTEPPTTKTAALQFVSQATERQTDRQTIRQPAAVAATEGDEAEGVSHDPADSPRGNCSQLPRNNNNNNINKSSRNLRYLCCEYTINIVAPSGIDLAHSIGRTDSSHSLCQ